MPRITIAQAAEIFGVATRTAERYRSNTYSPDSGRQPVFPAGQLEDGVLTFDEAEIRAWHAARPGKAGMGRSKGQVTIQHPCMSCGTPVPRRSRDEAADGSDVLVCQPCWKQDGALYKQPGWTIADAK